MTWSIYRVIFRLRTPLHVGWGKIGNLQRTRPYVVGRVLWGALTTRLTRDSAQGRGPAVSSQTYQQVGDEVNRTLAFTYFYPSLANDGKYAAEWPWHHESTFKRRFLSSYSGTALSYPQSSAATGMLHEVEHICSNTTDEGLPVFLTGYVFEHATCSLPWRAACERIQLGGERGYGWGQVEPVEIDEDSGEALFGGPWTFDPDSPLATIRVPASKEAPGRLLAHTAASGIAAAGSVEPLVGREWRTNSPYQGAGQFVAFNQTCFCPGSTITSETSFHILPYGIWENVDV